jgi:tetratricopeptide (TPR) repeat protein
MRPRLNAILPTALLVAAALPAFSQAQGRITGKVTAKADGKPIAGAKIVLKRQDRNWSKELITNEKGVYSQAGLEPSKEGYDLSVTAEGFLSYLDRVHVPLGDSLVKDIQLLKPGEGGPATLPTAQAAPSGEPGAKEENEGLDIFNGQVIPLVNEGKFLEALGPSEAAYAKLTEAMVKTKDDKAKAELEPKFNLTERVYGICLFENGKKAEAKPILEKVFARNEPEGKLDKGKWDQKVLDCLYKIAKDTKDAEGEKKYQAIIDIIVGPRPENAYNDGVNAYNAGKIKEAKVHIQKAIQIKADFADSYYMLGLIEINEGNMRSAKQHFQRYLELAPTGKKAAEVKEMLKAI